MRKTLSLAALGASVIASSAHAQSAALPDPQSANLTVAVQRSVANGPNDRALKTSATPDLQLVAAGDDKTVSLAWSLQHDLAPVELPDASHDGKRYRLGFWDFTATVSTALGDGDDGADLLSLGGFSGGTELKLAMTRFSGAIGEANDAQLEAELARASKVCEQRLRAEEPEVSQAQIDARCDPVHHEDESDSSFLEKFNPVGFERIYGQWFPRSAFTFWGVEAGANQDTYKYLDRTGFAMGNDSKFGFSATVFGGLILSNSLTSLTGSFTYSENYDAQPSVTLCQPLSGSIQSQCLTGADGPPERTDHAIFAAELRQGFALGQNGPMQIAVAPKVSFDVESDAYSIDVPVYLAQDTSSKLRGGVRFSYVNEKDAAGDRHGEAGIALFVGVPFSLFH